MIYYQIVKLELGWDVKDTSKCRVSFNDHMGRKLLSVICTLLLVQKYSTIPYQSV